MTRYNTEKFIIFLKLQTVMLQYMMFVMYTTFRKFPIENAENLQ